MLSELDLNGRRLGLQLYPEKDHTALLDAIRSFGAEIHPVWPYIYDSKAAETSIVAAIDEMADGRVDAIALTSSGQVRRLMDAATAHGREPQLRDALARTPIASVGPVVSDELTSYGLRTDIYPAHDAYFMKPLISAIAAALAKAPPRGAAQS
jgi:uroporphyrinogen-III synthase